jgi:DNA-binding transcriptional regulator YiaG
MANIASVLKEEIIRLARKEIRQETDSLKKVSGQYRSEIAALKRHTVNLEKQLKRLEKIIPKQSHLEEPLPEAPSKVRFTAKGFKTLRQRLGISAADTGRLLGVSGQTVYAWETGSSSPRKQQLVSIVILRGLGKREVVTLLQKHAQ